MSRVLVTGARGFVGHHLCGLLTESGFDVIGTTRSTGSRSPSASYKLVAVPDMGTNVDWVPHLDRVDYVVHLAARVHVMQESVQDPLQEFRHVNVNGTEQLLRQAVSAGVKRFVFLSSVKVHGEATNERPFVATDALAPQDPYGQSKQEAEELIERLGDELSTDIVIIRPPLVYGPGVGGNFLRLMKLVDRELPMPFGKVNNARSLVSVFNLCDLIRECLTNPAAPGKRFLVSDGDDRSTPDLIRLIAKKMSRESHLLPVPTGLLNLGAALAGKKAEMSRLMGSLQVDICQTCEALNWRPPFSMDEGVAIATRWYLEANADG